MKKTTGILIVVVLLALAVGIVQASSNQVGPTFTTGYNSTVVFCYGTNSPYFNNCVGGFRQLRIYAPDPAHNNDLFIHTCFQFALWICDNGFWMTYRDTWYSETSDFPHLLWTSGGAIQAYTEATSTWNKFILGNNLFIPPTFGPWNGPDSPNGAYPAQGQKTIPSPTPKHDKKAYP